MFDSVLLGQIALVAAVGGLIGLDRTAAGQFMISQPIVAGPLTGLLLGDPAAGFLIGASLELIWLLDLPIGTFVPADSTIAAIAATAVAVIGGGGDPPLAAVGFSILLTTALAPLTMRADELVRKRNARFGDHLVSAAGPEAEQRLTRAHLAGLAVFYLKFFILLALVVPAGIAALRLFFFLPQAFAHAMEFFVRVLPLLGAALVIKRLSTAILDVFVLVGAVIAALVVLVLRGEAYVAVLVAVAAGWIGAYYRERHA